MKGELKKKTQKSFKKKYIKNSFIRCATQHLCVHWTCFDLFCFTSSSSLFGLVFTSIDLFQQQQQLMITTNLQYKEQNECHDSFHFFLFFIHASNKRSIHSFIHSLKQIDFLMPISIQMTATNKNNNIWENLLNEKNIDSCISVAL